MNTFVPSGLAAIAFATSSPCAGPSYRLVQRRVPLAAATASGTRASIEVVRTKPTVAEKSWRGTGVRSVRFATDVTSERYRRSVDPTSDR